MHLYILTIRVNANNPNHHLYNKNGIWWCRFTCSPTPFTAKRVRRILGTRSLTEARRRRDLLLLIDNQGENIDE